MERGKVVRTDAIRLPDGQGMKDINETGNKFLGILQTNRSKKKK